MCGTFRMTSHIPQLFLCSGPLPSWGPFLRLLGKGRGIRSQEREWPGVLGQGLRVVGVLSASLPGSSEHQARHLQAGLGFRWFPGAEDGPSLASHRVPSTCTPAAHCSRLGHSSRVLFPGLCGLFPGGVPEVGLLEWVFTAASASLLWGLIHGSPELGTRWPEGMRVEPPDAASAYCARQHPQPTLPTAAHCVITQILGSCAVCPLPKLMMPRLAWPWGSQELGDVDGGAQSLGVSPSGTWS